MIVIDTPKTTHQLTTTTPGPWHTQGRYIVPADNGPSIGSAVALKAPSLKAQPNYDAQAYVNARLMAAAPCMYAALGRTLQLLQNTDSYDRLGPQLESDIAEILSNLERPL